MTICIFINWVIADRTICLSELLNETYINPEIDKTEDERNQLYVSFLFLLLNKPCKKFKLCRLYFRNGPTSYQRN